MNKIREMRKALGITQAEMSEVYGIPKRTIEDWEAGRREPAAYLVELLANTVERVGAMERRSEALKRSDIERLEIMREGEGYTIYIDGEHCGWGDLEDQLDTLNDWLDSGRTLKEFAAECQQFR